MVFPWGEKLRSVLWNLEVFTGNHHCLFLREKIRMLIDMCGFYLSENRDKVLTNLGPHIWRRLCLIVFGPDICECVCMLIDALSSNSVGFSHLLPFVLLLAFRNVITISLPPQGNILNHRKHHTSVAKCPQPLAPY